MTHKLTFGRHQLAVSFNRKVGRPKETHFRRLNKFIFFLKRVASDNRFTGNTISRVIRRLLENKKVRQIFSLALIIIVLLAGSLANSVSAFNKNSETEITALNLNQVELTTESSVQIPVETLKVTQGYRAFHQAIDLQEPKGTPVYPIMEGTIEEAAATRSGYGNLVIIDHGSGYKSLYAHLSKITVEPNEEVTQNTVIGTVGSTGRSSGPHLHLEVFDHDQPFNPLTILE